MISRSKLAEKFKQLIHYVLCMKLIKLASATQHYLSYKSRCNVPSILTILWLRWDFGHFNNHSSRVKYYIAFSHCAPRYSAFAWLEYYSFQSSIIEMQYLVFWSEFKVFHLEILAILCLQRLVSSTLAHRGQYFTSRYYILMTEALASARWSHYHLDRGFGSSLGCSQKLKPGVCPPVNYFFLLQDIFCIIVLINMNKSE